MVRGRLCVFLVVLVLAGCQGGGVGPETVTPAPVPTASDEVVPGAQPIASGHRMALADRSHTTTVVLTVTYPNGTTARLTDEFVVGADRQYRYERRVRGPYPQTVSNFTIWQNDTAEFTRAPENGTETVTVSRDSGFRDLTLSNFIGQLLTGFDLTAQRDDGVTTITGSQQGARGVPLPSELGAGRNTTLEAEIREDIVRRLSVRTRASYPDIDQSVDVRLRVTVDRVGASDPARPAWATAENATG